MRLANPLLPDDEKRANQWRDEARQLLPETVSTDDCELLGAIFAASSHLHLQAKHHAQDIMPILQGELSSILDEAEQDILSQFDSITDDDVMMRAIRHYRYRTSFALALAELSGHLPVDKQAALLSSCADKAIQICLNYLCRKLDLSVASITAIALGKLGAKELNYSSDIDLLFLYDGYRTEQPQERYVELVRHFVQIMQTQTIDGFAWRVDLRLRPDPGATALCLSAEAAISYYESIARSWERAVFIRARPVAGNTLLADAFLKAIEPFIWRRQLDYSLLEDLQSWISHKTMPEGGYHFDVKRGAYAIRHLEMSAHILLLLHGGRTRCLRTSSTDEAFLRLAETGLIDTQNARESAQLYYSWRQLEHRLQYCRDTHIYTLPQSAEEMALFARFAGFSDPNALLDTITSWQEATRIAATHPVMLDMIQCHEGTREDGSVFPAETDAQITYLEQRQFTRGEDIIRIIDSWMSGRLPATRSERARSYLNSLLPVLIAELGNGHAPDDHFVAFAEMVEALPSGVQFFALLSQHPKLIRLIADLSLNAPSLIRDVARHPQIFEQMMGDEFFAPLLPHPDFEELLGTNYDDGRDAEGALDFIRQQATEAKFRAEMHIISLPETALQAGPYLTALAEACLRATLKLVRSEFEKAHGMIAGSSCEIILLGRAGIKEMTPQSDIDIVFIYEGDRALSSDGARQLSTSHYYQRLAQRFISWTGTETAHGRLYELDARLRPDGNASPVATHFESWQAYLNDKAWAFEQLAFHKARLLDGSSPLGQKIAIELDLLKNRATDHNKLAQEISLLRGKLQQENPDRWNFKKQAGGLLDLEFLHAMDADHDQQAARHLTDILNHLTMLKSVMPQRSWHELPPALFQAETCRLMAEDDFTKAMAMLAELMQLQASQLDKCLAGFQFTADK